MACLVNKFNGNILRYTDTVMDPPLWRAMWFIENMELLLQNITCLIIGVSEMPVYHMARNMINSATATNITTNMTITTNVTTLIYNAATSEIKTSAIS